MARRHTNHNDAESTRGLKVALALVIIMMAAEITGGIFSHSLALISDAGHMLVDTLALTISLLALNLARRPATTTRTFGLHRAEIMAALFNGAILFLIAAFIFYEAYQRLRNPPEVRSGLMLIVASLGLVANICGMLLLKKQRHTSLNVRGAFFHILGDTISSVGVIIAGIIVAVTGFNLADPIVAIVIGIIILWGAIQLMRESSDILLESVPRHINMEEVIKSIMGVEGIKSIHDIHVWTITSGIHALSSHLIIEDLMLSHTREIIDAINHKLSDKFGITHTTLQLECDRCESCSEGFICEISRQDNHVTEHE